MNDYLLLIVLAFAVVVAWTLFVRAVRRDQQQIIVRFTASTARMTEALQRLPEAIRKTQLAMTRAREAGVFDDYGEDS